MCVCIIGFVVVLFKMSCNALSVVSGMCLFAVGVDNYNHIRKCTEQHTLKKNINTVSVFASLIEGLRSYSLKCQLTV
jgi:small neutral amino acid transporter SnatA (MarC family)